MTTVTPAQKRVEPLEGLPVAPFFSGGGNGSDIIAGMWRFALSALSAMPKNVSLTGWDSCPKNSLWGLRDLDSINYHQLTFGGMRALDELIARFPQFFPNKNRALRPEGDFDPDAVDMTVAFGDVGVSKVLQASGLFMMTNNNVSIMMDQAENGTEQANDPNDDTILDNMVWPTFFAGMCSGTGLSMMMHLAINYKLWLSTMESTSWLRLVAPTLSTYSKDAIMDINYGGNMAAMVGIINHLTLYGTKCPNPKFAGELPFLPGVELGRNCMFDEVVFLERLDQSGRNFPKAMTDKMASRIAFWRSQRPDAFNQLREWVMEARLNLRNVERADRAARIFASEGLSELLLAEEAAQIAPLLLNERIAKILKQGGNGHATSELAFNAGDLEQLSTQYFATLRDNRVVIPAIDSMSRNIAENPFGAVQSRVDQLNSGLPDRVSELIDGAADPSNPYGLNRLIGQDAERLLGDLLTAVAERKAQPDHEGLYADLQALRAELSADIPTDPLQGGWDGYMDQAQKIQGLKDAADPRRRIESEDNSGNSTGVMAALGGLVVGIITTITEALTGKAAKKRAAERRRQQVPPDQVLEVVQAATLMARNFHTKGEAKRNYEVAVRVHAVRMVLLEEIDRELQLLEAQNRRLDDYLQRTGEEIRKLYQQAQVDDVVQQKLLPTLDEMREDAHIPVDAVEQALSQLDDDGYNLWDVLSFVPETPPTFTDQVQTSAVAEARVRKMVRVTTWQARVDTTEIGGKDNQFVKRFMIIPPELRLWINSLNLPLSGWEIWEEPGLQAVIVYVYTGLLPARAFSDVKEAESCLGELRKRGGADFLWRWLWGRFKDLPPSTFAARGFLTLATKLAILIRPDAALLEEQGPGFSLISPFRPVIAGTNLPAGAEPGYVFSCPRHPNRISEVPGECDRCHEALARLPGEGFTLNLWGQQILGVREQHPNSPVWQFGFDGVECVPQDVGTYYVAAFSKEGARHTLPTRTADIRLFVDEVLVNPILQNSVLEWVKQCLLHVGHPMEQLLIQSVDAYDVWKEGIDLMKQGDEDLDDDLNRAEDDGRFLFEENGLSDMCRRHWVPEFCERLDLPVRSFSLAQSA